MAKKKKQIKLTYKLVEGPYDTKIALMQGKKSLYYMRADTILEILLARKELLDAVMLQSVANDTIKAKDVEDDLDYIYDKLMESE